MLHPYPTTRPFPSSRLTWIEARWFARHFGLSTEEKQLERLARGWSLFQQGAVLKPTRQPSRYTAYLVTSQRDPHKQYLVRVFFFPRFHLTSLTCTCPDFEQGWHETGIHIGYKCKHVIAVLFQRDLEQLEQQGWEGVSS